MKHERVDQLIQAIRDGLPEVGRFDMLSWCHCIAGHAATLAVGRNKVLEGHHDACLNGVSSIAKEWLGLSDELANRLFHPPCITSLATDREWAVKQLEAAKLEDA